MHFQPFYRTATFEMEEEALQASTLLQQQIKFHLYLKVQTSNFIHTQDSLIPHSSYSSNYNIPSVVQETEAVSYDDVRAAVGKAIMECRRQGLAESCLLNDEDKRKLTDLAWEAACNTLETNKTLPPVYNVLALAFKAVRGRSQIHSCISFRSDVNVVRESRLPAGERYSCCICLEEIDGGGASAAIPCSHVFHAECIGKWLRTSRLCPLCRYEIPMQ